MVTRYAELSLVGCELGPARSDDSKMVPPGRFVDIAQESIDVLLVA
jgi:hypothetical protein